MDIVIFAAESKLNTYVYGPKDDPYHRRLWKTPYPADTLAEFEELVALCKNSGIDFYFAVSPGDPEDPIDLIDREQYEKDFALLVEKCQAFYDIGVRHFAIFMDDIPNRDGIAQAEFLNDFQKRFIETHDGCADLLMVPSQYAMVFMTAVDKSEQYTLDMSATLDAKITYMWTGNDVVDNGGSNRAFARPAEYYGRKPVVWWNFPVNDYRQDSLFMGPLHAMSGTLNEVVDGFLINPMLQPYASMISIYAAGVFCWNPADYKEIGEEEIWKLACNAVAGDKGAALYTFAQHANASEANPTGESEVLAPLAKSVLAAVRNEETPSADELAQIKALSTELLDAVKALDDDSKLADDLRPYFKKAEAVALAGIGLCRMLEEDAVSWEAAQQVLSAVAQYNSEAKVKFASTALWPKLGELSDLLLPQALATVQQTLVSVPKGQIAAPTPPPFRYQFSTNMTTYLTNTLDNLNDGNTNTIFWGYTDTMLDVYVQADLGAERTINSIEIVMDVGVNSGDYLRYAVVEVSLDGAAWEPVGERKYSEPTIVIEGLDVQARFVRVMNNKSQQYWVTMDRFVVNGIEQSEAGSPDLTYNAIDGSLNSFYATPDTAGSYTYQLPESLYGVTLHIMSDNPALLTVTAKGREVAGEGGIYDLSMHGDLTEVEISWQDGASVRIYEIVAVYNGKTALNALIAHTEQLPKLSATAQEALDSAKALSSTEDAALYTHYDALIAALGDSAYADATQTDKPRGKLPGWAIATGVGAVTGALCGVVLGVIFKKRKQK